MGSPCCWTLGSIIHVRVPGDDALELFRTQNLCSQTWWPTTAVWFPKQWKKMSNPSRLIYSQKNSSSALDFAEITKQQSSRDLVFASVKCQKCKLARSRHQWRVNLQGCEIITRVDNSNTILHHKQKQSTFYVVERFCLFRSICTKIVCILEGIPRTPWFKQIQ